MKNTLLKALISTLLLTEIIVNKGYTMERHPHHIQEIFIPKTISSYKMISPQEEAVFIPLDVSKLIFNYLKGETNIASFWGTCPAWKAIGDDYYKKYYSEKNMRAHIFPWKESPHLPPRILNRVTLDYRFLLGMHRNILLCKTSETDRTRFEITCDHIMNTPYLPEKSLIKSFADLLIFHLHLERPTYHQNKVDTLLTPKAHLERQMKFSNRKLVKMLTQLSKIRNQNNIIFQNEIVLYFYCISFIKEKFDTNESRKDPFFMKITCNLFDVIKNHNQLVDLRKMHNKTSQKWEELIDLDCAPLYIDYFDAGISHYTEWKYKRAIAYFKMARKAEHRGRENKRDLHLLHNLAINFESVKNYQNAAYYFDKFFKQWHIQTEEAKEMATYELDALESAANVHMKLGNKDKEEYYLKCIKQYEIAEKLRQMSALKEKEEVEAFKVMYQLMEVLKQRELEEAADPLPQVTTFKKKKWEKYSKKKTKKRLKN